MENKLKETIKNIAHEYDTKLDELQIEHIVNLCLNDIACHPNLEKFLNAPNSIRYFIIQTILQDVSRDKVKRLA